MNGNVEAYSADPAIKLAKQLRKIQVTIAIFKPASSAGEFYWVCLTIPAFEKKGQLLK